jgi:glucose/arabinose dehydrogenase
MSSKHSAIDSTALAALFAGALYAAAVQAQPAPAPKVDPGSALYGQPEGEGAAKLAPVAPPPIPTAADKLPVAKLKVPDGFKVEVFASGVTNARSLRVGDKGTVFVGSRLAGKVHAIREKDGKREVKVIASDLHRPNCVALHNGALYVAELSKVWRYDNIDENIDNPPETGSDQRSIPERRGAWLDVHRHRTRRQALRAGRCARQHQHAPGDTRADPPHGSRRQEYGSRRARRA